MQRLKKLTTYSNNEFSEYFLYEQLPVASLHWIIADQSGCITVESVEEGLKIYENPVGVLANNPSFDKQLFNLNNYMCFLQNNRKIFFLKN